MDASIELPIDEFVKPLSKCVGLTARLMHDLYDGAYDQTMKAVGSINGHSGGHSYSNMWIVIETHSVYVCGHQWGGRHYSMIEIIIDTHRLYCYNFRLMRLAIPINLM